MSLFKKLAAIKGSYFKMAYAKKLSPVYEVKRGWFYKYKIIIDSAKLGDALIIETKDLSIDEIVLDGVIWKPTNDKIDVNARFKLVE